MPNKNAPSSSIEEVKMPSWAALMMGVLGVGLMAYLLPILDIMNVFFTFFVLPILFIGLCILGMRGAYTSFSGSWNNGLDGIRTAVAAEVAKQKRAAS